MSTRITPQTETRAFLALLDPATKKFHLRTFDDKPDSDRAELRGNLSGTIDKVEPPLLSRNAKEAGVFVVINEGGHKKDNITRVRAVFADTDGAPLKPIVQTLAPHAVIESSPGRYHVYWLVNDDFPLEMFTPIQEAISDKFGTDPNVKDLPRVMRLPGFKHNKYDPVDVKFHSMDRKLERYTYNEIIDGLGLAVGMRQPTKPVTAVQPSLLSALSTGGYITPDRVEEGGRNCAVLAHVGHLRGREVPEDLIPGMALDFNRSHCSPPLNDDEILGIASRYEEQAITPAVDLAPDEWPDPQKIKTPLSVSTAEQY